MTDLERGQISDETSANSRISSQTSSNERINVTRVSETRASITKKKGRNGRKTRRATQGGIIRGNKFAGVGGKITDWRENIRGTAVPLRADD